MLLFLYIYILSVTYMLNTLVVGKTLFNKKPTLDKKILLIINIYIFIYVIFLYFLSLYFSPLLYMFITYFQTVIYLKILYKEDNYSSLVVALITVALRLLFESLLTVVGITLDQSVPYNFLNFNKFIWKLSIPFGATILLFGFKRYTKKVMKFLCDNKNKYIVLIISLIICTITVVFFRKTFIEINVRVVAILVLFFVIIVFMVLYVYKEQREMSLKKIYDEIEKYSKSNEELVADYRKKVHENSNKLLIIKGMLENNENPIDYINSVLEDNKYVNGIWVSDLNYISIPGVKNFLNYKLMKLKELGAEIEIAVSKDIEDSKLELLDETSIKDLYTILGVLMDNMYEALSTQDKKLASLLFYIDDNLVNIEFANTYKEKIDLDNINVLGYSTKGKERGVGLSLVNDIIKNSKVFKLETKIIDKFFVQHIIIKTK